MNYATTRFRNVSPTLGHPNVDREAGIIRNVSVISEGEARGHGVQVDDVTLKQVQQCAARFGTGGVGVKFNPQTFDHGPGGFAGSLRNLRIAGTQLVGDLYVLATFPNRDYLLELAASQPQSFGLSIDFDMYQEDRGGMTFARCAKLDAVTVVDVPAANACGLFRVGSLPSPSLFSKPTHQTMSNLAKPADTATTFSAKITDLMRQGNSRGAAILKARNASREGFNAWCAAGQPKQGAPAATGTGFVATAPATATAFAAKLHALQAQGMTRGAAIQKAMPTDREGFNAWNRAGQPKDPADKVPSNDPSAAGKWAMSKFKFKGL